MAIAEISIDELAERATFADRPLRLIDVREVDEYEGGHVPGAKLVPLGGVVENIDAFLGEGLTYVICKSGGRSMRACELVDAAAGAGGVETVNVAGGTMGWVQSGRDVVTGDQPW